MYPLQVCREVNESLEPLLNGCSHNTCICMPSSNIVQVTRGACLFFCLTLVSYFTWHVRNADELNGGLQCSGMNSAALELSSLA